MLFTKVVYPNCASTEIRTRLRLRSIYRGARNRLDLLSITSYDREAGSSAPIGAQLLHSVHHIALMMMLLVAGVLLLGRATHALCLIAVACRMGLSASRYHTCIYPASSKSSSGRAQLLCASVGLLCTSLGLLCSTVDGIHTCLTADFNPDADDNDDADADVRDHRRGMCTFAFVPWDEVGP